MEPTINITKTDLVAQPAAGRGVPIEILTEDLPQARFVTAMVTRRLAHVANDSFSGAAAPSALAELSTAILVRSDRDGNAVEAFVQLRDGQLAFVDAGYGSVRIEVAAASREAAAAGAATLREALRTEPPAQTSITIAFWMRNERGGTWRNRSIDAPAFNEIEDNYTAPVRGALEQLCATRAPDRGRLILWRGEPGTGKSHALRALARAWAPWCSAHFVMDPEELLGHGAAYLLDLLSWDGDDENRWRLVILEDAGELIAADARAVAGQALSRLLNVADGLLGQGPRTLLLITTNEPVGRLHPATRRPGRCLADIEFAPLTTLEANAWLAARGHACRVDAPTPLAELFARAHGEVLTEGDTTASQTRFGFARALAEPGRAGR